MYKEKSLVFLHINMDKGSTTAKFYINSDQFVQRDGGETTDLPIDRVDETYIPHLGISEVSVKSAFLKKELKDFSDEFNFNKPNIIYEKVMNETRGTLIRNSVLMSNVGKFYRDAFLVNLNSLYNFSPQFFSSNFYTFQVDERGVKVRYPNQYKFEAYEKYIYLLCLIVYLNENAENLKGILSKDAAPMIAWARVRNDESLKWIIAGPNDSYDNPPNFIQHYNILMSTASQLGDLLQQNLLSKTNMTYEELTDFKYRFINNPNVYSKNLDKARQWNIVIRDARKLISNIDSNNNLVFDASYVDLGDTSNKHILAEYNSLVVEQDKETSPPSAMLSKALELLLNNYSTIHVNELSFRYDVFGNDISRFPVVYLVFPGIYTVEHTVYDDQPRGILRIAGTFTNDKESRRYKFIPNEEFLSFNGSQTFVRNFQFYITTDPVNEAGNSIIPHAQNIKFMKEEVFNHMLGTNLSFDNASNDVEVDEITVEIPMDFQDMTISGNKASGSRVSHFLSHLPVIPKLLQNYLENLPEHIAEYSSLQISLSHTDPFSYTYVRFIPKLDVIQVMWFGEVYGQPGLEDSLSRRFRLIEYMNNDSFEDKYGFVGSLDSKIQDVDWVVLPGWGMFDEGSLKSPVTIDTSDLLSWMKLKLQWFEIASILKFFNESLIISNGRLVANVDFQGASPVDISFISSSSWEAYAKAFEKNPNSTTFKNIFNQLLIMSLDDYTDKVPPPDPLPYQLVVEEEELPLTEAQAIFRLFMIVERLKKFKKSNLKRQVIHLDRKLGLAYGLPFKLNMGEIKHHQNKPLNGSFQPPNLTLETMKMIRQRGSTYGAFSGPSPLAYTNATADYHGSKPRYLNSFPISSRTPYLNTSGRAISGIVRPRYGDSLVPGAQRQMQTANDYRDRTAPVLGGVNTSYEPMRHLNLQPGNAYGTVLGSSLEVARDASNSTETIAMPVQMTPNVLYALPTNIYDGSTAPTNLQYSSSSIERPHNTLVLTSDDGEKYLDDEENYVSLIRFYDPATMEYEPLTSFIFDPISKRVQMLDMDVLEPSTPRVDLKFSPDLYVYCNRKNINEEKWSYLSEVNKPVKIQDLYNMNLNFSDFTFTGHVFEIDNHIEISKLDYDDVFGLEFIKNYPYGMDLSSDMSEDVQVDLFRFTLRSGNDYITIGVDASEHFTVFEYSEGASNSKFLAWLLCPTSNYVPTTGIDALMSGTYTSATATRDHDTMELTGVNNSTDIIFELSSNSKVIRIKIKAFEPSSDIIFSSSMKELPWLQIEMPKKGSNVYSVQTSFSSPVQDIITVRINVHNNQPNPYSNIFRGQSVYETVYAQHWNRRLYILSMLMTPIPILSSASKSVSSLWFRTRSSNTYIYTVENDFPYLTSSEIINEKWLDRPIQKTFHSVVIATSSSIAVDNEDLGSRTCYVYSHQIWNFKTDDFNLNDIINREKYDILAQDKIQIKLNTSSDANMTITLHIQNKKVVYFTVYINSSYVISTVAVNGNIESEAQYIIPLKYFGKQVQGEVTVVFNILSSSSGMTSHKYVTEVKATVNFSYLVRLKYINQVPMITECYHMIPDSSMTSYTFNTSESPLSLNFLSASIENPTIPLFRYFQNNLDTGLYTDQDNKDPFIINRNKQIFTNTKSRLGKSVDPDLINIEPLTQSIVLNDEFVTENVNGLIKLASVDNSMETDKVAITSKEGILLMAPNDNLLLSLNIE